MMSRQAQCLRRVSVSAICHGNGDQLLLPRSIEDRLNSTM
jgi:hypothetical protein